MATTTAETWSGRVKQWKRSGLAAKEFARRIDVNPRTLAWWRWRLGSETATNRALPTGSVAAHFIELVSDARADTGNAGAATGARASVSEVRDAALEIELAGGIRIRLFARFDPTLVGGLVAAIERR